VREREREREKKGRKRNDEKIDVRSSPAEKRNEIHYVE